MTSTMTLQEPPTTVTRSTHAADGQGVLQICVRPKAAEDKPQHAPDSFVQVSCDGARDAVERPPTPRDIEKMSGSAAPRSVQELNSLIAATSRAVEVAHDAQGLNDFIDGVVVLAIVPLHVGYACARGYALAWINAPMAGAARGRARARRQHGTTASLRIYEHLSGSLAGATFRLGAAPITAALVASTDGAYAFCDDLTYAATRIPRGLWTYLRLRLSRSNVDEKKGQLLAARDALVLERARSASQLAGKQSSFASNAFWRAVDENER